MNEYASVPPAVQNLESTEKIAHAIASSLTKANESVALYRSNIGKKITNSMPLQCAVHLISHINYCYS